MCKTPVCTVKIPPSYYSPFQRPPLPKNLPISPCTPQCPCPPYKKWLALHQIVTLDINRSGENSLPSIIYPVSPLPRRKHTYRHSNNKNNHHHLTSVKYSTDYNQYTINNAVKYNVDDLLQYTITPTLHDKSEFSLFYAELSSHGISHTYYPYQNFISYSPYKRTWHKQYFCYHSSSSK